MKLVRDFYEYQILDMSEGMKLESWNGKELLRPDPQIIWNTKKHPEYWDKVDAVYAKSLGWCLHHKTLTIVALFTFFGLSLLPFIMGKVGTDFMAQQDNARLSVTLELQRGTRIE